MNLRQRTLVSVGVTLVGLILAVYFCSHAFLLDSFRKLEVRETTANVHRAENALNQEVAKLHGLSPDWANWDDTYKFMQDKNQAYIDANLSTVSIDLDLQLFLDLKGRVFQAKGVERFPGTPAPDPEEVRRELGFDKAKEHWPIKGNGVSGFIELKQGPLFVSVRPIKDTSGKAKLRGWLVFAHWLNKELELELADTAHIKLEILRLDSKSADSDLKNALQNLKSSGDIYVTPLDKGRIAGYKKIHDMQGRPFRILKVVEPRAIYTQGSKSVDFFVYMLTGGSLIFGLVFMLTVEASVLRRLVSLSGRVEKIGNRVDHGSDVTLPGNDELSKLSSRINDMLTRIRDGRELLQKNNESLRRAVDELASTNLALENAVEGIARIDKADRLVAVNQAFAKAFGVRPEDLIGKHTHQILPKAAREGFAEAMAEVSSTGRAERDLEGRREDGSLFFSENVFLPFVGLHGESDGHYWFLKDISDRKMLEVQIQHQAFHDALTGLPNRVLFLDRLTSCLARSKRHGDSLAVIFIDLDNFKVINDSLGHDAGDSLLIGVSQILRSCVRPEDTVARLGGDEFTILLSDLATIEDAVVVAKRVIEALAAPLMLKTGEAFASASLGIRWANGVEDSPEDILRDADTAMYQAKSSGKSGYAIFESSMNVQAVERMELEAGLRRAITQGEFSLSYQPIVELESGMVTGMEALLRWHHPQLGLISPELFIPVAEETGLIVDIGNWTLERACTQTKEWNEEFDSKLVISVNLSGRQLQTADSVQNIKDVLSKVGMDPNLLKLEITESVLMKDTVGIAAKLSELRALGVKIAIDDFGTGYSSMSSLSSFPIDTVKIDRSFVAKLSDNAVSEAVVKAIITLSQTMNFEVTAEGIERWEQLVQLKRLGCSTAQGYMFFAPMNVNEFGEELATGLLFRKFKVTSAA